MYLQKDSFLMIYLDKISAMVILTTGIFLAKNYKILLLKGVFYVVLILQKLICGVQTYLRS